MYSLRTALQQRSRRRRWPGGQIVKMTQAQAWSLLILLLITPLSLKQGIDLRGIFNHSKFLKNY
jgi:hypothetical protein